MAGIGGDDDAAGGRNCDGGVAELGEILPERGRDFLEHDGPWVYERIVLNHPYFGPGFAPGLLFLPTPPLLESHSSRPRNPPRLERRHRFFAR